MISKVLSEAGLTPRFIEKSRIDDLFYIVVLEDVCIVGSEINKVQQSFCVSIWYSEYYKGLVLQLSSKEHFKNK